MNALEKLRYLIDNKIANRYTLAKELNMSKTTLTNYYEGLTTPSGLRLDIINRYIEGKYGNDLELANIECTERNNSQNKVPHYETKKMYAIPHIEEHAASCGIPNGFSVAIKREDCESYIIPDMPNCDFTIRTRGRSMVNRDCPERNINERDIVACKIWTSRSHIRWGEVYALATNDGIVVKQIQESEKEGHIKCVSFNEEEGFKPYDLPVEEITDWAIVVGVISVKTWN